MIRTVIFDLGKVLVPFDFQRGYVRMAERCSLEPEEIRRRLSESGMVVEFESGRIEAEDFALRVNELLGADVPYEEFRDIWFSVFLPHTLIPESMVETIRRQRRTVLLSNTNHIHYTMLRERYPILNHFDAYCLSHEVRAMKPDPRIYERAVELAGCDSRECFFTDDVPEYVEGARRFGIDAVQFQSAEQIAAELRQRGIEC
jgi:putative hydrolase of the HAD superfamily